jgi:serine/threonine protein phosphatase 1
LILALADLHGRADLLEGVLEAVPADTKFVFLGDAIDRGHRNRDTIRLLSRLADEGRMTLLRGNHEAMVLEVDSVYDRFQREKNDLRQYDAKVALENWIHNGGDTVIVEYGGWDSGGEPDAFGLWGLPPELLAYCERTQFTYRHPGGEKGDILCVHAAPPSPVKGYRSVEDSMVWARPEDGPFAVEDGILLSVHGHTPIQAPMRLGQNVFCDLGAKWTGCLCAFDLDTMDITVFKGAGDDLLERLPVLEAVNGVEPVRLEYKLIEL